MTDTEVTFESLVGLRELSGVGFGTHVNEYEEDSATCSFVLDGVTYTASEDPSDGYRSSLDKLIVGGEVVNTFSPQKVLCALRTRGAYGESDLLVMTDVVTGKDVLTIGTENTDDYYPFYVAEFDPTAMAINNKERKP